MGRMEFLRTVVDLTDRQFQSLQSSFDPLSNSEYNGLDMFIAVYDFIKILFELSLYIIVQFSNYTV